MLLDHLSHAHSYHALGPRFEMGFDYLRSFDGSAADGRFDLDGDRLYALVQTYIPGRPETRTFESHRQYADIQYMHSGREIISYCLSSRLIPKQDYDDARDVTLYEDHPELERPVYLNAGEFAVLWPQDGHKPACIWDQSEPVRKVVLKLRLG